MIEFDLVVRRFGRTLAVNGLSLTIRPGELFALLGPNGAGKTTTIRMLVGLLQPDSGHVRVCGVDWPRKPREASSRLGYVPDEQFLYEKLSGRELLQFAAEMHGLDRATSRDRIRRETERFELGDFLDNLTETYSHGMRQRLIFATSLLHDPQVLVVDEPMVGLDPRRRGWSRTCFAPKRPPARPFSCPHTRWVSPRRSPTASASSITAGSISWARWPNCGRELSAPHQALEHLFLELTNGHAPSNRQGAVE